MFRRHRIREERELITVVASSTKRMTNGHHEAIPPLGTVQIVDKTAATQATAIQATVSHLAGEFDESAGFADKNGPSQPLRRACLTMHAGVNGAVHRELQTQRERERWQHIQPSAALSWGREQNDMRAFPALHCLMHKSDLAERHTLRASSEETPCARCERRIIN